ncbi:MAG: hypothetical protein EXR75_08380 [Myxococcales bacterium]|nr:hypothetical protein [Myxococcales bacterium]
MSAIVALLDEADVPRPAIENERVAARLLEAMGQRARVRFVTTKSGRCTLGLGAACAIAEGHMASNREGSVVAVLDGYIDDAGAIADGHTTRTASGEPGAAAAIVRAYERWGAGCADMLRGEFAFVLWDARRRELIGARDALGVKPLYYHRANGFVRMASEPHAVFADTSFTPRPCFESLALFLSNGYFENGPTLYEGVFAVPSGHFARVRTGAITLERYWRPDAVRPLAMLDDEAYARLFAQRFERAVRTRLPREERSAVLLSGGIDSSAVACEAVRQATDMGAPAPALVHLSYAGLGCDERPYARAVADHCGAPLMEVDVHAEAGRVHPSADRQRDVYYHPGGMLTGAAHARASEAGARVVLSGHGGDLCFDRTGFEVTDRLRQGELRAALRECGDSERAFSVAASLQLVRAAARIAIPPRARLRLRQWRTPRDSALTPGADDVVRRFRAAEHARRATTGSSGSGSGSGWSGNAELVARVTSSLCQVNLADYDRVAAAHGVEPRHPFFDRELVELQLGLPVAQRHVGGQRKSKPVLRRALRPLLPAVVYRRAAVTEFASYLELALHHAGSAIRELFVDSRLAALGVIRHEFAATAAKATSGADLCRILNHAALELWLRKF